MAWHDGPDAAGRDLDPSDQERGMSAPGGDHCAAVRAWNRSGAGAAGDRHPVSRGDDRFRGRCGGGGLRRRVAGRNGRGRLVPRLFDGPVIARGLPPLLRADPRVHAGDVPMRILERARYQVWVERPLRTAGAAAQLLRRGGVGIPGMLRIRRTRSLLRRQPAPVGVPAGAGVQVPAVQAIPADVSLERWWAGW